MRGPLPRFIRGNIGDMIKLWELEAINDMDPITHNILDRLLHRYAQWKNDHGMLILPLLVL